MLGKGQAQSMESGGDGFEYNRVGSFWVAFKVVATLR